MNEKQIIISFEEYENLKSAESACSNAECVLIEYRTGIKYYHALSYNSVIYDQKKKLIPLNFSLKILKKNLLNIRLIVKKENSHLIYDLLFSHYYL